MADRAGIQVTVVRVAPRAMVVHGRATAEATAVVVAPRAVVGITAVEVVDTRVVADTSAEVGAAATPAAVEVGTPVVEAATVVTDRDRASCCK